MDEDDDEFVHKTNKRQAVVTIRDGHHVVSVGTQEIWDGSDLAIIRETLSSLSSDRGVRAIGVDLQFVKYIDGGFFGMLWDYADQGHSVRLYSPTPQVSQYLWFREFFRAIDTSTFQMALPDATEIALAEPPAERLKSLTGKHANRNRKRSET